MPAHSLAAPRGEALIAIPPLLRLRPLIASPTEISDDRKAPGELSGSIELARVSFRYLSSGPLVLDNVTLKIAPGEYLELRSLVAAPTCSSLLGPECTAFSMRRAGTERYASDPEYRASIP
jgi:hypothetical protein